MSDRALYAVLAGINDYRPPVTALRGCQHDVDAWEAYLKSVPTFTIGDLQILRNAEATKSAIVNALKDSLQKADSGDVVFFFFSGHGTREAANPVFAEIEQDMALESLVCFDSITPQGKEIAFDLLSDKELHYLLSVYGRDDMHIVTIFDCCHSGGITRNMQFHDELVLERRYIPSERLGGIAPVRDWSNFLFADHIPLNKVQTEGWLRICPQRRHITLSACQNDQSAFEQNGKGVFTSNLIDVLRRSQGAISYYDLQSRVRVFTQNQFRQTPEIYAVRGFEDDVLHTFLDEVIVNKGFTCLCYLKKNIGWVIDLGAIHGVSSYSGPVEIQIGHEKHEAPIMDVRENYSMIDVSSVPLNPTEIYDATLKSYYSGNTTCYFDRDISTLDEIKREFKAFLLKTKAPFVITEERMQASYVLRMNGHSLQICNNDEATRPVTEIRLPDTEITRKALQYMRHIAQWEYIRGLSNPGFQSQEYPVQVDVFLINAGGRKEAIEFTRDTIEFQYEKNSSGDSGRKMKVRIRNTGNQKYYCSILYLSNTFQVYGGILDGKVVPIDPGQEAWARKGQELELDLEPYVVNYNYPYSVFYLKLFASPEPFNIEALEQSALPAPGERLTRGESGGDEMLSKEHVQKPPWFTRTLCFKGCNPLYQESKP